MAAAKVVEALLSTSSALLFALEIDGLRLVKPNVDLNLDCKLHTNQFFTLETLILKSIWAPNGLGQTLVNSAPDLQYLELYYIFETPESEPRNNFAPHSHLSTLSIYCIELEMAIGIICAAQALKTISLKDMGMRGEVPEDKLELLRVALKHVTDVNVSNLLPSWYRAFGLAPNVRRFEVSALTDEGMVP